MNFYALDLETQSLVPDQDHYALEPWRILEGSMRILIVCVYDGISNCGTYEGIPIIRDTVTVDHDGCYIWTWNGIFDIACLIASGVDCSKIKWLDAMSAAKRVFRSQHTDHPNGSRPVSWSLGNIAKNLLTDWEHYNEFMDVKEEFRRDLTYLERRCNLDTEATLLLGQILWDKMDERQRTAFLIESESLYPAALAWMIGTPYNAERAAQLKLTIEQERYAIISNLTQIFQTTASSGKIAVTSPLFYDPNAWVPVLGSNDKLGTLLYDVWGIPFDEDLRNPKAKTDKRPVSKDVLTFLIERYGDQFPQLALIKKYRELKSREDKFLKGPVKTIEYLGSNIMRHQCRINSTYTGRMTYVSKG